MMRSVVPMGIVTISRLLQCIHSNADMIKTILFYVNLKSLFVFTGPKPKPKKDCPPTPPFPGIPVPPGC